MTAKKASTAKTKAAETTLPAHVTNMPAMATLPADSAVLTAVTTLPVNMPLSEDVEFSPAAHTLERLELARKLPIVPPDVVVQRAVMAPRSIEAFRTEDGRTMRVVLVNGKLAAQEMQPTEGNPE